MANIQKRGDKQYQTDVRRKGYPRQTQTFESKALAEVWSRKAECDMAQGSFRNLRPIANLAFV